MLRDRAKREGPATLSERVAYGALAIAILLAVILLDVAVAQRCREVGGPFGDLLRRGSVIPLSAIVLVVLGVFELHRALRLTGARPVLPFALLMAVVLMLSPWLSAAGWLGQSASRVEGYFWLGVWTMASVVGCGVLVVLRREPDGALRDFGATVGIILYLGFLGSFAVQMRCGRDVPGEDGAWLLLITLLVTKSTDIGGFFAGRAFGRHRLAPTLSPGKTVEGAVGGLAASAVVAVVIASVGGWLGGEATLGEATAAESLPSSLASVLHDATRCFSIEHRPNAMPPLLRACIFGVAVSVVGQFGDLLESSFKRDAHIKDSGKRMPAIGGILDMIDSPILAVPVGWFLLTAAWSVV